jgi:hypothetical integral membrane protein (TIGR02206 family)
LRQFSFQHLAALGVMVLAAGLGIWIARRWPGRPTLWLCRGLAIVILVAWSGEYVADLVNGTWSVRYTLPVQLTDAVSIVAVLALLTRRQLLVELTFFWAFTATLQAVITPDLGQAFPSVYYFTYFGYHLGAIVAATVLVFGLRLYPRPLAAVRAFGATLAWAGFAALIDLLTGGNYMYLSEKPLHSSLLSVLGPWPWYIFAAAGVGLVMLALVAILTALIRGIVDPQLGRQT